MDAVVRRAGLPLLLIYIAGIALATRNSTTPKKIRIKLGFVAPLDPKLAATSTFGLELKSAFKLAVELINRDSDKNGDSGLIELATDFNSQIQDSGYSDRLRCQGIAKQFAADSDIVGVVGAFRSTCSIEMNQYFKTKAPTLTQISYGSTAVELSDKLNYPRFFRTVPSDIHQAQAMADIVERHKWRMISTIATSDSDGQDMVNAFQKKVKEELVTVVDSARFNRGDTSKIVEQKVKQVKKGETRINVISALPNDALTAFHQIQKLGMTGEGWAWLVSDKVTATSFDEEPALQAAMNGLVGLAAPGGSGLAYLDLLVSWKMKKMKDYPGAIWNKTKDDASKFVAQLYDAVYAYYKAFDNLAKKKIIQPGESVSRLRDIIYDELKNFNAPTKKHSFKSITGRYLYFDANQDVPANYRIVNYIDGKWTDKGFWNSSGLSLLPGAIMWPGGTMQAPTDRGRPGKIMLRVGFITPYHPELAGLADLGRQYLEAFQTALEMLNNDNSLSVKFLGIERDSGTNPTDTCRENAKLFVKSGVVAVIGGYRSVCSMSAADILGKSENMIPQISYASTSSKLADVSSTYKYFFRTAPSNVDQAKAIVALIKMYKWKKICSISTDDAYGKDLTDLILAELRNTNVSVIATQWFPLKSHAGVVRPEVAKLKKAGCHVGLVLMVRNDAEVVFQQLKELNMVGRGMVWIGSDKSTTSDFHDASNLETAMQGVIGIQPKNGEGRLFDQFMLALARKESARPNAKKHTHIKTTYLAHLFDAVHCMALELSELARKEIITSKSRIIDIRKALYDKLKRANSKNNWVPSSIGYVKSLLFDKKHTGPPAFEVVNLVGKQWMTVGNYRQETESISLFRDPIFPGGITIPIVGPVKPSFKIAAFFPTADSFGPISDLAKEWRSAFKIAVEAVNRDSVYNIQLEQVIIETSVDVGSCGRKAAVLPSDVSMIIGGARSECSMEIARMTNHSMIPQISYASTSAALSNKLRFPFFFRTCPSDVHQAKALSELVRVHEWETVGTIAVQDMYSKRLVESIEQDLLANDVTLSARERMTSRKYEDVEQHLTRLKDSKSAVNLVVSRTDNAEMIFQEAIEKGMTGKGWTWLGSDGSTSSTFKRSPNLQRAMQGMVGTRPRHGKGALYEKYLKEWQELDDDEYPGVIHTSKTEQVSAFVPQVFDAVLAYATALHRLNEVGLINEKMSHMTLRKRLVRELRKMNSEKNGFLGASGSQIYFTKSQDGLPIYDIVNLKGESWSNVGSYTPDNGLHLTGNIVWSGGGLTTPPDQQPQEGTSTNVQQIVDRNLLVGLCVVFGIFSLALILAVITTILFKFRHTCRKEDNEEYINSDVGRSLKRNNINR